MAAAAVQEMNNDDVDLTDLYGFIFVESLVTEVFHFSV
jgi:hypothetical protein